MPVPTGPSLPLGGWLRAGTTHRAERLCSCPHLICVLPTAPPSLCLPCVYAKVSFLFSCSDSRIGAGQQSIKVCLGFAMEVAATVDMGLGTESEAGAWGPLWGSVKLHCGWRWGAVSLLLLVSAPEEGRCVAGSLLPSI